MEHEENFSGEIQIDDSLVETGPDYVENNLIKFIHILRNLGIRISLAESIEAVKALKAVDIINKEEVKITLRALLVKDSYEKKIFDKAFEAFFVSIEEKLHQQKVRKKQIQEQETAKEEAEEELKFKKESVVTEEKNEEIQLNFTEDQKETYTKLDPEIQQKIKEYIEQSFPGHLGHSPHAQPMLERMVSGALNYWKRQFKDEEENDNDQRALEPEMTGDLEMDMVIEQVVSSLQEEDKSLLTQDLKQVPEDELPKVTMIIKKLSHRLATKISRRFQHSKKTGKIDLRRTIRKNIKYGGVMLDLKYKKKKIQKPEFLLICDVSDSMARYAVFVLQFIYGLSNAVKDIESFIFSEDLERITDYFTKENSFETTMAEVVSGSQQWGKTTDFNQALKTFQAQHMDLLKPETLVFIMSDTKTLEVEEAAANLKNIKRRVKDIVWLNTLPESEWEDLKSVQAFKELTKMVECYTIEHLRNSLKIQILT